MTSQDLAVNMLTELRNDCLAAAANQPELRAKLKAKRIAVTGGTGFMGTWIAEMVSALNDEYGLGVVLDLYARNTTVWAKKYPHLGSRPDIFLKTQDVRSPFEFQKETLSMWVCGLKPRSSPSPQAWRPSAPGTRHERA